MFAIVVIAPFNIASAEPKRPPLSEITDHNTTPPPPQKKTNFLAEPHRVGSLNFKHYKKSEVLPNLQGVLREHFINSLETRDHV